MAAIEESQDVDTPAPPPQDRTPDRAGAGLAFLSYFGYHIYHGEFGINSKDQLRARATVLQARA